MTKKEFYFPSADGKTQIHAAEWLPEGVPRGVLQIAHGVTEHILAYEEVAEYFTEKGFLVVGNDHLGHGLSIAEGAQPMYFGPEGSWRLVEEDLYTCYKLTKERYADIPYFLLGLSLGSFISRSFLIRHPKSVDGAVFVGTGQTPEVQLAAVRWIAGRECRRAGEDHTTPLIKQLSFGTYNKAFAPNRTDFDWLCSSEQGVDTYLADKLRQEAMSAGLFREMLSAMIFTGKLENQKQMDKETPILLVSGDRDPVGECGKGVKRVRDSFKKAGMKDVTMKLYPGLRHNLFLEKEKREILMFICAWMMSQGNR